MITFTFPPFITVIQPPNSAAFSRCIQIINQSFNSKMDYDQNRTVAAITKQHTATYGDFRSPIRANFQNVPIIL